MKEGARRFAMPVKSSAGVSSCSSGLSSSSSCEKSSSLNVSAMTVPEPNKEDDGSEDCGDGEGIEASSLWLMRKSCLANISQIVPDGSISVSRLTCLLTYPSGFTNSKRSFNSKISENNRSR